jgi:hypothetical protein
VVDVNLAINKVSKLRGSTRNLKSNRVRGSLSDFLLDFGFFQIIEAISVVFNVPSLEFAHLRLKVLEPIVSTEAVVGVS